MAKYAIAGVGYGKAFDSTGNQLFKTTTLTDSGFNTSTSIEEIRGGAGNSLQAQYVHTGQFEVALKDCLSDLMYTALVTGSTITAGANIYTTETVVTTVLNQITVLGTPSSFGTLGTIGWYSLQGSEDVTKITFTGSTANVTIPIGTTVCVTYLIEDDSARVVEILSNFVPSEVHLVFTLPLFKAGIDATNASTSSQLGEWIVDVPRFMFNGALEYATTSSSTTGSDLSGKALAYTSASGCGNKSIYATITEVIYGKDKWQNVKYIAIPDSDIDLAVSDTQTIEVIAVYNDGTSNKIIANSELTLTSATPATATINASGVITAVGAGSSVIEAVVTSKTSLNAKAVVTVTT